MDLNESEKKTLERMLKTGVLTKAIHIALARVGMTLDASNTLDMQRSAMAYQYEAGARGLVSNLFDMAGVKKTPVVPVKKLKHITT